MRVDDCGMRDVSGDERLNWIQGMAVLGVALGKGYISMYLLHGPCLSLLASVSSLVKTETLKSNYVRFYKTIVFKPRLLHN